MMKQSGIKSVIISVFFLRKNWLVSTI